MKYWEKINIKEVPDVKVVPPGPKSNEYHQLAGKYMKGYSGQVKLFPVVFEEGNGPFLRDVDGNTYIDFSSGIYVTNCGHCHPKIVEYVKKYLDKLWNCHDFTTPVKTEALQLLSEILPGDINGIQFYSDGTTAIEAGLRAARAITEKFEFISFWGDFHGKTLGSVSLSIMSPDKGIRSPGFFLTPRPYCYRCPFKLHKDSCNLYCVDFVERIIDEETTNRVAAVVMEPIQGWAGSIFPPDEFIPELKKRLEKRGILLFVDEILTGMGRTGQWFACQHYNIVPDIITVGKGLGNGFPVTIIAVREKYKDVLEKISSSSSFGGNPLACASIVATIKVIKEENLIENARKIENVIMEKLYKMKEKHPIIGNVRGKGCIFGIELVKDQLTKEPFEQAGKLVYQKAFRKGLAWVPAGHILRLSPPLIITEEIAIKGTNIIEEAIYETEKELGYL